MALRRNRARPGRRGVTLVEVAIAVLLMGMAAMLFASVYPTASRTARASGNHAQAISVVQHKIDELRALGYGRLNYDELRSAGIIDAAPNAMPFRFDGVDGLASLFPNAVGTISVAPAGTDLASVTVRLEWRGAPGKAMEGRHEVQALIANE